MYQIGIDAGSTYTKYCIADSQTGILDIWSEETPVKQKDYFDQKTNCLYQKYKGARIISCGYGKNNIMAVRRISELTALSCGCAYMGYEDGAVVDIGGQDTKVLLLQDGRIREFFVNEKCAAGCGMFLVHALRTLKMNFQDIDLQNMQKPPFFLSTVCAVFAQSEIVELLAQDVHPQMILLAVIWQILGQAKVLLAKVNCTEIVLSGGFAQIPGISRYAEMIWGIPVHLLDDAPYLSAVGCAYCMDN